MINKTSKLKIFFDESGKRDQPIKMMGAIMVPERIYDKEVKDFQ